MSTFLSTTIPNLGFTYILKCLMYVIKARIIIFNSRISVRVYCLGETDNVCRYRKSMKK